MRYYNGKKKVFFYNFFKEYATPGLNLRREAAFDLFIKYKMGKPEHERNHSSWLKGIMKQKGKKAIFPPPLDTKSFGFDG